MSDFTLPLDKDEATNLSATGSSLILSSRVTPRSRPNSARLVTNYLNMYNLN